MEEYIHSDDTVLSRATLRVKGEEVVVFGIALYRDGQHLATGRRRRRGLARLVVTRSPTL